MKILFLSSRFPYPPLKGDQVVTYHRIKYLSRKHKITLITFASNSISPDSVEYLSNYCTVIFVKKSILSVVSSLFFGLFKIPLQVSIFSQPKMQKTVGLELQKNSYDILHVSMLRMWSYAKGVTIPVVADFVDSMQLNFLEIAKNANFLKKIIYNYELNRLSTYEPKAASNAASVILVSAIDARYFPKTVVDVIPNGVDCDKFIPKQDVLKSTSIVFSGNMGYSPNIEAVLWFSEIFIELKKEFPDVVFRVVGQGWSRKLERLKEIDGIQFSGFVEDMALELCKSSIAVAPMQSGSGMQNKVLEAMACGLPMVLTSKGMGDIKLINGEHALIVNDRDSFLRQIRSLLKNPEVGIKMGQAAREFVLQNHSWHSIANSVDAVYQRVR